jgi:hypothetical protein
MPDLHRPSLTKFRPTPVPTASQELADEHILRRQAERTRQIRGLLLLAAVVLVFILLRAGPHNVFPSGWWRLW